MFFLKSLLVQTYKIVPEFHSPLTIFKEKYLHNNIQVKLIEGVKMDFVKANEILSVLEKLDSDSESSIIGALNLAEHVEKTSKEFYEKEANKTKGTELEPFFNFLVKEEEMHLEKILELKKNINEKKAEKIGFEQNAAPQIHVIPAGQNDLTAVLYALWREKKAAEFYAQAASKTTGVVKSFFEELSHFEEGHVKLIESYVEAETNAGELIMG